MLSWAVRVASRATRIASLALAAGVAAACATPAGFRVERIERYLQDHRELPSALREPIESGHVVAGMDVEQVRAVLGEPVQKRTFPGPPPIESWLYPAARLHQGHYRYSGGTLLRLVFVGGRLALMEPI